MTLPGGISRDYAGYYEEGGNWALHISKLVPSDDSFSRIDYRTVGPADASGEWEHWINAGPDDKIPFDIDTDDRRITAGFPDSDGQYIRYRGWSPFHADRGTYHFSNYIDGRWEHLLFGGLVGEYPDMTGKELDFLAGRGKLPAWQQGGSDGSRQSLPGRERGAAAVRGPGRRGAWRGSGAYRSFRPGIAVICGRRLSTKSE